MVLALQLLISSLNAGEGAPVKSRSVKEKHLSWRGNNLGCLAEVRSCCVHSSRLAVSQVVSVDRACRSSSDWSFAVTRDSYKASCTIIGSGFSSGR